jgi:O-glycosyl hydrolase
VCASNYANKQFYEGAMDEAKRAECFDKFFTDKGNGLDLSFLRIMGFPHRYYTQNGGWNFAALEEHPHMQILFEARDRGVEQMYYGVLTPPPYMKTSNRAIGGSLKAGFADDLGRMFADFLLHARNTWNLPIDYVAMQNEPHQSGLSYAGCHLSPTQHRDVLLTWASTIQSTPGLEKMKIGAPETSYAKLGVYMDVFSPVQLDQVDWLNHHAYWWEKRSYVT